MQLIASEVSTDYYSHPAGIVKLLMLTIACMQAMELHILTQGRFNNHTTMHLVQDPGHGASLMDIMNVGNLWHSKPVCYNVGSVMSPLYPRPPVYEIHCLGGQYRLLHKHKGVVDLWRWSAWKVCIYRTH